MNGFTLLRPLFTQGMLVFLAFFVIVDLLAFKYLTGVAPGWFIIVAELGAVFGYIIANGFANANAIPWGFAKKWYPEVSKS